MKPDARVVRQMFDDIAPRYDLLNHLLSFGMDFWWRWNAAGAVREKRGGRFLDLATGTGDLAVASLRAGPRHVVGVDFAFRTLLIARQKVGRLDQPPIDLVSSAAGSLPFREQSFDAILVGFGVRNFPDIPAALNEMHRVLRPGGLLCILELSRPRLPLFSPVFGFYFHRVVPFLGKRISGSSDAYKYLPESVDAFPEPEDFLRLMRAAGFPDAGFRLLTFGTAAMYVGRR